MKGLLVYIMGTDATNGGVTSRKRNAILLTERCKVFDVTDEHPALVLIEEDPRGARPGYRLVKRNPDDYNACEVKRVRAVPADADGNPIEGGMFGGHFITTSDSRFPYESPIPVFDRFETAAEQRMYSV